MLFLIGMAEAKRNDCDCRKSNADEGSHPLYLLVATKYSTGYGGEAGDVKTKFKGP